MMFMNRARMVAHSNDPDHLVIPLGMDWST